MKTLAHSAVRWFGVIILLTAYFLVAQGMLSGKSILFNLINGAGSVCLIANSLAMTPRDWAVAVFNMVWFGIAFSSIVQAVV